MISLRHSAALLVSTSLFSLPLLGEVTVEAEVLSSDTTSSTVKFTFEGDLSGLDPQVNLQSFLFLDFSSSPGLEAAFPASEDLTSFESNSVTTNTGSSVNKVELRNNEDYYFDRISFVFEAALNSSTSFQENSVLEIELPTSVEITTEDFEEIQVYWCFPAWGTNNGRGTLVGITNPAPEETAAIRIYRGDSGSTLIEFTGTLESSPDLNSDFSPVAGATSPYLVPPGSPAKLFFRSRTD